MKVYSRSVARPILMVCCSVLFLTAARGNEPAGTSTSGEKEKQLAAERLEFMLNSVRDFQVVPDDDQAARWQLYSKPLLRWSNPVGGVPDGVIVMWTDGNRPAVLAQVFQTKDGYWIHECQSVALRPFVMRDRGRVLWQPRQATSEFKPIEGASPPAETKVKRLVQMRALAREFTAFDDFKINTTDQETTRHELRLMSNPLYRYDVEEEGVVDAAVFAFTLGTDPEVFVLLEAREARDGSRTWHYALTAMTCWAVEVKHRGKSVWQMPERLQNHSVNNGYHVWVFDREK